MFYAVLPVGMPLLIYDHLITVPSAVSLTNSSSCHRAGGYHHNCAGSGVDQVYRLSKQEEFNAYHILTLSAFTLSLIWLSLPKKCRSPRFATVAYLQCFLGFSFHLFEVSRAEDYLIIQGYRLSFVRLTVGVLYGDFAMGMTFNVGYFILQLLRLSSLPDNFFDSSESVS